MALKGCKILLCEDEKDLSDLFSLKLKEIGCDITVVDNGVDGLKKIKELKPSIVLMDLVMPEKDGYETLKEVKKDPSLKDIAIYAWSNLTQKDEIARAKKLGIDGYLIKSDYTPSKLTEKLEEILKTNPKCKTCKK